MEGCRNSSIDGGHSCSALTADLRRNRLRIIYSNVCKQPSDGDASIKGCLDREAVYINAVHLGGGVGEGALSVGRRWERKKRRKFKQNLKILLGFFFPSSLSFLFSEIPARMCRRAGGLHPDEKWRPSL